MQRLVVGLVMFTATAHAEPPAVAISVNAPVMWLRGTSIASSVYVGTGARTALRFNVARSEMSESFLGALGGSDEVGEKQTLDLGAGYVFYPDGRLTGLSYELGALVRDRDRHTNDGLSDRFSASDTRTLAARALVGFSAYGAASHLFIAGAIGASLGYRRGDGITQDTMETPTHLSDAVFEMEAYLRFGVVL